MRSTNLPDPAMEQENSSFVTAFKGYHSKHAHEKRALAVAAALEVIRADAFGGNAEVNDELKSLAKYADNIQKALDSGS